MPKEGVSGRAAVTSWHDTASPGRLCRRGGSGTGGRAVDRGWPSSTCSPTFPSLPRRLQYNPPFPAESARFLNGGHFFHCTICLIQRNHMLSGGSVGTPMGDAGPLRGRINRCNRLIMMPHPPAGCLGFRWGGISGLPDATSFQTNHPSAPAKPHDLPATMVTQSTAAVSPWGPIAAGKG